MLDITGNVYGSLTVLNAIPPDKTHSRTLWHCRCECGNTIDLPKHELTRAAHPSCGCLDQIRKRNNGLKPCVFRKGGVECRVSDDCRHCGWNPKVEASRKAKGKRKATRSGPYEDLKAIAKAKGVYIKQVAAVWPCSYETLRVKFNERMNEKDRAKFLRIVDEIAKTAGYTAKEANNAKSRMAD